MHSQLVIVNLDSRGELERLGAAAHQVGRLVRAGVRGTVPGRAAWAKFGIPLEDLPFFWREAKRYPQVCLYGIHFHGDGNKDASHYEGCLA